MADYPTAEDVLRRAGDTRIRASRLAARSSVLGWWRERKFVQTIDHFVGMLRSVSQREVEHAAPETLREIGEAVDAVIADVERFIGGHSGSSVRRVERDRHLVKRIYELRASYEKLNRRVTAQPGMTDLRWKVRMDTAHREQ
jgi:hypothetical protein